MTPNETKSGLSFLRQETFFAVAFSLFASMAVLFYPSLAFAAGTLGDVICTVSTNLVPYGDFISAVAYISGVLFILNGFTKLKAHSDNPGQTPLGHAVWKFIGGAACLALPQMAVIVQKSVVGQISANGTIGCAPGAVSKVSGASLDVLFTNLFGNIAGPIQGLLSTLCLVMGALFVARGLMRAAKYGTDQKASAQSILANLIIGAVLLAAGQLMDVVMSSVFGITTSQITAFPGINWSVITGNTTAEGLAKTDKVINAILVFVQVIGMIGFLRGWLIIKAAAEGGNASIAAGVTHIVGGVMAINISGMAVILNNTFGLDILK